MENKYHENMEKPYKKFVIQFALIFVGLMIMWILLTCIVDPLYHYHAPIGNLIQENQAYQNIGIAKNYSYTAILTGSSMTENFRVSKLNKLFGQDFVKLSFQGGRVPNYEVLFNHAFENDKVKIEKVLYGADISAYIDDANLPMINKIPDYLYDKKLATDVKYLLNKNVFFEYTLIYLKYYLQNYEIDLDDAYTWDKDAQFGKTIALSNYVRPNQEYKKDEKIYENNVKLNLDKIGKYIKENPDVQFDIFFPPYSVLYYDCFNRQGKLEAVIYSQKMVAEYFIRFPNVRLSSFMMDKEIICNLDNYKDYTHYFSDINNYIAEQIKEGTHLLTYENIDEYFEEAKKFLCYEYNYEELFD